jgi:hypothetical protein
MGKMITVLSQSWTGKWCPRCGCKVYLVWDSMITVCCCRVPEGKEEGQSYLDRLFPLDPRD